MRVLVVSVPAPGHLNPMVPLIEAFVAGGDRVVVASGRAVADVTTRHGAEFWEAGTSEEEWFGRLAARTRGAPGDGLPAERINHYFVPRLFAEIAADDMIDGVLACARALDAELVVYETYALAAPLAAEVIGAPAVHHLISPLLDHAVLDLAADALAPLWRAFGQPGVPPYGGVYDGTTLEICPPSLEEKAVPRGQPAQLRPVPLPERAASVPERPLVYLTMGTFFNGDAVFRAVIEGLADESVDVVVTLGEGHDPGELGPTPANTTVESFVPQASLLPRCSAVIHHGGSGTMLGALAHGLPQLVLPQGADNYVNARLLERAGAGAALAPGDVEPHIVRRALRELLSDPGPRRAAERCAREIAAMPGPVEVARDLRARYGAGGDAA